MEPDAQPSRKRRIIASVKGLLFTMMVLAALWFGLRYVLTPLVLPEEMVEAPAIPADLEARIKTLETKLSILENKPSPAPDLGPLEARLNALENAPRPTANEAAPAANPDDIAALKAEMEQIKSLDHGYVRALILTSQLQDAVRSGRPFASELAALQALRPALKETLAPLSDASTTGIATLAGLTEQFTRAIEPALTPESGKKTFVQNLRSLVKIRKIGESQQGADDEAVLARAEARLAKGDVAATLQEIATLSPRAADIFAAWKGRAETHLAAQAALVTLQTSLAAGETK
ncbi:MAG: hypothetical protein SFX19_08280 [Alphaproteobacteria bacterium]|nr:hypothetical protein [Alphaproteobacteria bacterium]